MSQTVGGTKTQEHLNVAELLHQNLNYPRLHRNANIEDFAKQSGIWIWLILRSAEIGTKLNVIAERVTPTYSTSCLDIQD